MAGQETVADPLRGKRSHPETSTLNGTIVATAPLTSDQSSKRVKLEDNGETNSQPRTLQKGPEPQKNKPQVAAKQEEISSIPEKATVAPIPVRVAAPKPSAPVKEENPSTVNLKPVAPVSKPQTLHHPTEKQSALPPIPQCRPNSIPTKVPSVPLTHDPAAAQLTGATQMPRKDSPPPLKALTFRHLHRKYGPELDYMLVEFKKLERQLLGAPVHQQNPPKAEPKGSRERREKLHVFILHLEDTKRQVEEGLAIENEEEEKTAQAVLDAVDLPEIGVPSHQQQRHVEEEKKSSSDNSLQQPHPTPQPNTQINVKEAETNTSGTEGLTPKVTAAEANLSSLPPGKEREESVQRIEEHILVNLLPVKVRLTKQLAAQKGATRNPLTAPVRAGAPAATTGGTIAEAVEAKRKAQEEELLKQQLQQRQNTNHYGKPISGTGSSLTTRLHGGVLTSSGETASKRPILYAGVAPGSTQVSSSVNAVAGAHPGLIGKDATTALSMAEDDRRRLKALEENATRVALGGTAKPTLSLDHRKPAALPKQPEGPATLAARARAVALAAANGGGGTSKISRPNQQFPTRSLQHHRPHTYSKPAAPYPSIPVPNLPSKPKKPHVKPNFNDPSLTSEQRFELRMKEARWRQRKRRRERRRKRLEGYYNAPNAYHLVSVPVQQHSLPPPPQLQPESQPDPIKSAAASNPAPAQAPTLSSLNSSPPHIIQAPRINKETVFGPRTVEYVCAVCNESYVSTCDFNPWWSLSSHECPKCGKVQIPKLDITAPANDIDYHPALLSQEDNPKVTKLSAPIASVGPQPSQNIRYINRPSHHAMKSFSLSDSEVSFTDESDGDGGLGNYDESSEEEETSYDNDMDSVTREDRAEKEEFGQEFKGETLTEDQSRRLLVLIEHASICPGK